MTSGRWWWLLLGALGAHAGAPDPEPRLVALSTREQVAVTVHVAEWSGVDTPARRPARVVLLPGVLGSAASMSQVTTRLVANGVAVAVIDPLGMGHSSRPADADYSLHAQAGRVLAVLDTLGWETAVVAGVGTSGTIALRAAARAPGRVTGVVLIAGGPVESQHTDGVASALRYSRFLNNVVGRAVARRKFVGALRARSANDGWLTESAVRAYTAPLTDDLGGTLRALQAMGDAVEPLPLDRVLPTVRAPVTMLVGAVPTDGAPTVAQHDLLRAHVHAVRVDTIAGAGALLHEERPDAVAGAILDLSGVVPSSGPVSRARCSPCQDS